jgi:2-dehydropantoate 2-reductase
VTRFVVVGAGAIGGVAGGLLTRAGLDVLLVARGEHAAALRRDGLRLHRPEGTEVVHVPIAEDAVTSVAFGDGDVVLLAVKSQDTEAAVRDLASVAPPSTPVVCLQNGLDNERVVLRRFARVLAANVMVPASHTAPGVSVSHSSPVPGIIDVGRFPHGSDALCDDIAAALRRAGFDARADAAVGRWKRAKLLVNVGNAVRALCGTDPPPARLLELVGAEARAALRAAGLDWVPADEYAARRAGIVTPRPVPGAPRIGSSTAQSLARGTGSVETDYLNGEIVLLGRLHGVPTPANALVCVAMREAVARGASPGSLAEDALLRRLAAATAR